MKSQIKPVLAISLATLFIVFMEFLRNEVIFKSLWTDHYASLGIEFPSDTINGIVWFLWSLALACIIYFLLKKFNLKEVVLLVWVAAFVMMWLVIGNLSVLPTKILVVAIPLSLLEVLGSALIIKRLGN